MRGPRARPVAGALLAACCLVGCAGSSAPRGWLPTAVEAQREAHGGWASLQVRGESRRAVHEGELLAIQADSVFILEREACIGLPTAKVVDATVMGYDSNKGPLARWTLMGTLTTPSHGYFLILSAPVWIITGSILTGMQSRVSQAALTSANWERARAYARFPQGLPPGLDRASLRPK